ncbi:YqaJ viral recombinase family protein [Streptomyces sp. NPDC090306]|uniref:YqaJ viral recombinase family nuclease n=1 Tax=Streptomyces sp. NPDC090306 TaxID=3365961 RepID=UPI0037FF5B8B
MTHSAPETPPAPGAHPTTRTASTPAAPLKDGDGAAAKTDERLCARAAETPSAPYGSAAGPGTIPPGSGPAALDLHPAARLILPAGAERSEWLARRRWGICGTDVAAILDLDTYGSPLHVWRDKLGHDDAVPDPGLDRAARRGNALEPLVAELFAEETGLRVVGSPGMLQSRQHNHRLANPDRFVLDEEPAVLECKTRSWRAAHAEGWYGDTPPDRPVLQLLWYLIVCGLRRGYLAGLVDDELLWWRVDLDDELAGVLTTAVDRFWTVHVLGKVQPRPGASTAAAELLARLFDVREGSELEVDPVATTLLLQRRRELKDTARTLDRELTSVENELRAQLGDSETAVTGGHPLYSWRRNGQFAPARFAAEHPELAARYTRPLPGLDVAALAADHPHIYEQYRARVLRPASEG